MEIQSNVFCLWLFVLSLDCFYEERPAALANCPKLRYRLLQVEKNKCVGVSLMETNRAPFPFFHRRLDTIKGLTDLVWEVK